MEVSHEIKFGKVQYDPIYAKLCNVCMKALSKKTSGRIITKLLTFAISDWGNFSGILFMVIC